MSIAIVVNLDSTPPRFELTLATPDGSVMTKVNLKRNANGVKSPTRVQPNPGSAAQYVEDYEAPWETDVYYTASVTYGAGITETWYSSTRQLTPGQAWAIHPTVPALSVPIDSGTFDAAGVVSITNLGRASTAVEHPILGSSTPVVTTTGPRASQKGTLSIATVTDSEEDQLWALVEDQTPLLIRIPPSWGWNWVSGYYSIGDVAADRFAAYGPESRRVFTLPFTHVQSPAGSQTVERSWADVITAFPDWPTLLDSYADWPAVMSDTRSS